MFSVMKRFFLLPLLVLVLTGCSRAPYKILDRQVEGMGFVVKIRAEVPAAATKEELESWCGAITQSEKGDVVTNIEFIEDGAGVRQKAFCMGGQVTMVSDLQKLMAPVTSRGATP